MTKNLEDNGEVPPLIIFYQCSLQERLFGILRLVWVAGLLRFIPQA
jgi:hypothetical protein